MTYLCECDSRSCRRTLQLSHHVYELKSRSGRVLHPECAARVAAERPRAKLRRLGIAA